VRHVFVITPLPTSPHNGDTKAPWHCRPARPESSLTSAHRGLFLALRSPGRANQGGEAAGIAEGDGIKLIQKPKEKP